MRRHDLNSGQKYVQWTWTPFSQAFSALKLVKSGYFILEKLSDFEWKL